MSDFAHPEYLIDARELSARLGDPNLVILDCTTTIVAADDAAFRIVSGLEAFERGHIPGARHVDLERDLSSVAAGLLFSLPTVEAFGRMATTLGIGRDSFVVAYSTAQPGWAARVWLMLRAFGFENAAVLDGGFGAWQAADLPVDTGAAPPPVPAAVPFAWSERGGALFVGTGDVEAAIADGGARLVNALPEEVFRGVSAVVYGRPGHIPGSVNVPTGSLVDAKTGHYLDAASMEERFARAGIAPGERVIAYCGAGVAASNVAFGRLLLGHGDVAVYDGSMLEWARDPARPVVTAAGG